MTTKVALAMDREMYMIFYILISSWCVWLLILDWIDLKHLIIDHFKNKKIDKVKNTVEVEEA